jgi:hypothetical protein
MQPLQANTLDVIKLVFVSYPKTPSQKLLYGKAHYHDTKSTCPAKDLIFFDNCSAINIPKLDVAMLTLKKQIRNL